LKIFLNCLIVLFVLVIITTFACLLNGVKHQNFKRGISLEKALSSLDAKPDRTLYYRGYETLLYAQLLPPGTIEYRFKNGKFVRREYTANKLPSEY